MSNISNFLPGNHYTFNTKAPAILGTTISAASLVAIADYTTALKYENVAANHARIYPLLPLGTKSDYTKYVYLIFKVGDKTRAFASEWIDYNSLAEVTETTAVFTISNCDPVQTDKIRKFIISLGLNFTVT